MERWAKCARGSLKTRLSVFSYQRSPKETKKKLFRELRVPELSNRNEQNHLRVHRGVWTTRGQAVDKLWTNGRKKDN